MKQFIKMLRQMVAIKLLNISLSLLPTCEFRDSFVVFIVNHIKELNNENN